MKKQTAITLPQRARLAAVLGGTNMGLRMPDARTYASLQDTDKLDAMVYSLWSGYMDSDDMEEALLNECRWWYKSRGNLNSKKITVEYVRRVWPDVGDLVFGKIPAEARANAKPNVAKCM